MAAFALAVVTTTAAIYCSKERMLTYFERGSITVLLTSCFTCFAYLCWISNILTCFVVSKQEVLGTALVADDDHAANGDVAIVVHDVVVVVVRVAVEVIVDADLTDEPNIIIDGIQKTFNSSKSKHPSWITISSSFFDDQNFVPGNWKAVGQLAR